MCIAVPAEVVSIDGPTALVDVYGKRFVVSLMMLSEDVAPGDFVALQAQRYAVAKVAREDAEAAKRFFEDIFPELAVRAPIPRVA
jgi:hydrogenase expression/formation protein HypC